MRHYKLITRVLIALLLLSSIGTPHSLSLEHQLETDINIHCESDHEAPIKEFQSHDLQTDPLDKDKHHHHFKCLDVPVLLNSRLIANPPIKQFSRSLLADLKHSIVQVTQLRLPISY